MAADEVAEEIASIEKTIDFQKPVTLTAANYRYFIKETAASNKAGQQVTQYPVRQANTVLVFHATWCGPCKQLQSEGIFKTAMRQADGKTGERGDYVIVMVDVDEHPQVAKYFGATTIPAMTYCAQPRAKKLRDMYPLLGGGQIREFVGGGLRKAFKR